MYENCKILGPYTGKDGRKRLSIRYPNGKWGTKSYPKYLMEQRLGRYLLPNETVDHIDGNFTNDDTDNMRVISRSLHVIEDVKRCKPRRFICPLCGCSFVLSNRKFHDAVQNRLRGRVGPFCGKSCAGKYGKSVQLGSKKGEVILIDQQYTTIKNSNLSLHEETLEVDIAKTGNP